jgi:hypothetical protein
MGVIKGEVRLGHSLAELIIVQEAGLYFGIIVECMRDHFGRVGLR